MGKEFCPRMLASGSPEPPALPSGSPAVGCTAHALQSVRSHRSAGSVSPTDAWLRHMGRAGCRGVSGRLPGQSLVGEGAHTPTEKH